MTEIYSTFEKGLLLHQIFRKDNFVKKRIDICDDSEGLQVAALKLGYLDTFKPHQHVVRERMIEYTQETWIVIEGAVSVIYYDVDGTILSNDILLSGDCTITFRGGHTYECLSEDALVYEVKTGPYDRNAIDKAFL